MTAKVSKICDDRDAELAEEFLPKIQSAKATAKKLLAPAAVVHAFSNTDTNYLREVRNFCSSVESQIIFIRDLEFRGRKDKRKASALVASEGIVERCRTFSLDFNAAALEQNTPSSQCQDEAQAKLNQEKREEEESVKKIHETINQWRSSWNNSGSELRFLFRDVSQCSWFARCSWFPTVGTNTCRRVA